MKRKKWSEEEERSLLAKYAELVHSGTLSKLKTREKKFKPIAEYVNQVHHLSDPVSFPFRWSWRDVSIKVQNMRHQYLGVKIKIRVSANHFNWADGQHHWENFLRYKEVFGDVEIDDDDADADAVSISSASNNNYRNKNKKLKDNLIDEGLGLGFDSDNEIEGEEDAISNAELGGEMKKLKRLGLLGRRVLELREDMAKREDKRRERNFNAEKVLLETREKALRMEELQDQWEDEMVLREKKLQELEMVCHRRMSMEKEVEREKLRRMEMEKEEMQWRETMLSLQIQHEKSVMQMYSEACQNQMQMIGVMGRMVPQFFGSPNDALGALAPEVLQNLQHPSDLLDNVKPTSDSEFIVKGPKDRL